MMAIDSFGSRTAQSVITVGLMLLFTALRIWILDSQKKSERRPAKGTEIFSIGCTIWCTTAVIVQVILASIDEARRLQSPIGDTAAFQLRPDILQFDYVQNFLHTINLWVIKGAYLSAFWEASSRFPRKLMHSFYALCAFTVAGLIVSILVLLLYCNPISQNWYVVYIDGHFASCQVLWSLRAMAITTALNAAGDIGIMALGISIVRILQITWRVERAALCFIFLISSISLGATIGRYLTQAVLANKSVTEKGVQELLVRIEIIFATAAYGLTFPRAWLRPFVRHIKAFFNDFSPGLFSITASEKRGSRGVVGSSSAGRPNSTDSLRRPEAHELPSLSPSIESLGQQQV